MTSSTWQKCNRHSSRAALLISIEISKHVDQNFQIRTLRGRGPRLSQRYRRFTFHRSSISQLPVDPQCTIISKQMAWLRNFFWMKMTWFIDYSSGRAKGTVGLWTYWTKTRVCFVQAKRSPMMRLIRFWRVGFLWLTLATNSAGCMKWLE